MTYPVPERDLENLLTVAAKLRLLAADTENVDDNRLYLTAAEALETRAASNRTAGPVYASRWA